MKKTYWLMLFFLARVHSFASITNSETANYYDERTGSVGIKTNWYREDFETNFVESPNLRIVNGQVCDTQGDIRWKNLQGKCLAVSNDKITVATFTIVPVYSWVSVNNVSSTTITSHHSSYVQTTYTPGKTLTQTGKKEVAGPLIFLKNEGFSLIVGQTFSFKAKSIGIARDNDGGGSLPLWECGKPYLIPVVQTVKTKLDL